ncbi:sigma-70 family RNA polymerase sigma factor [Asticcacaulis sp. 201]|uniref:sigma-70 family RNA polymerase sigma factor n=1 Tax=Asticcacaulis sp. 201 TaxID=3028787 RepID=UPI00291668FD|nr:sigma-70 family RNA polymerase sigma factor [Asticcacaulis sp. 201]MDV6331713.1 sigma-70 family RNA polymerase sigma factor [Asticcacaulis sp. 201]
MDAEWFEGERRYLLGVAYRMLGTMAEAEDAVQDTFLRIRDTDPAGIAFKRAYLTRIVTRICLDVLKSAHRTRVDYVGPWLPEPLHDISDFTGAPSATELADDLSMGLLYALERLTPLERASFLLHDVFDIGFADIAATLDRSEDSCRQLASRARAHVRASRPRFKVAPDDERRYLEAFVTASQNGDVAALEAMLAQDVKLYSDGGGKISAAINILEGPRRVGAFMAGIYQKFRNHTTARLRYDRVNGAMSLLTTHADGYTDVMSVEIQDGQIRAVWFQRNPDKLTRLN